MNMFGYIGFDPLWIMLAIPGLLLGSYAQFKLKGTYSRYMEVPASSGISGAQAAREILDSAGLQGMEINVTPGHLTDHYDPMRRALFLSEENYYGRSLAAIGVAAHEAGHALQHKAAYFPMHLRSTLVPVTNIATQASFWIMMIGFAIGATGFVLIGLVAHAIIALFHLVTLPVEFDASKRAKEQLARIGLIRAGDEARGVAKVLNAAAMTYVAALLTAMMQLLYFVLRFTHMRERES